MRLWNKLRARFGRAMDDSLAEEAERFAQPFGKIARDVLRQLSLS